jgi:hypothetical protein
LKTNTAHCSSRELRARRERRGRREKAVANSDAYDDAYNDDHDNDGGDETYIGHTSYCMKKVAEIYHLSSIIVLVQ